MAEKKVVEVKKVLLTCDGDARAAAGLERDFREQWDGAPVICNDGETIIIDEPIAHHFLGEPWRLDSDDSFTREQEEERLRRRWDCTIGNKKNPVRFTTGLSYEPYDVEPQSSVVHGVIKSSKKKAKREEEFAAQRKPPKP